MKIDGSLEHHIRALLAFSQRALATDPLGDTLRVWLQELHDSAREVLHRLTDVEPRDVLRLSVFAEEVRKRCPADPADRMYLSPQLEQSFEALLRLDLQPD